jgi:glycosyltransferase involved in cell wall biosynthesis
VTIVPEGLDSSPHTDQQKASTFTFLYVGRMARSKRVADIIRAFALVRRAGIESQLWLVGEGDKSYEEELRSLVSSNKLQEEVRFWGRVSTSEKYRRMAEAHVLLMASVREGWGLVVLEANACGTPSVAYDVAGLRDAVRHGETGLLVRPLPKRLAEGMMRLTQDQEMYERLATAARAWSTHFSFDDAAAVVFHGLLGEEWSAAS